MNKKTIAKTNQLFGYQYVLIINQHAANKFFYTRAEAEFYRHEKNLDGSVIVPVEWYIGKVKKG